ncbi:hypothetical protein [Micromonospora sp. WMMD708]|uniref:hypothetical protein n=1 Tax=Micromonospora sp. WMMD708 TaxID=3403464 RepID=UPI003BF5D3AC
MSTPRIDRRIGQTRLHLQMPYSPSNRAWLHDALGERTRPRWNDPERRWEIARTHLMSLARALADRFGAVDLYLEFKTTERCDSNCQKAKHSDCECSCLGTYHGGGIWGGWTQVGRTTLVRPGVEVSHMRLTA